MNSLQETSVLPPKIGHVAETGYHIPEAPKPQNPRGPRQILFALAIFAAAGIGFGIWLRAVMAGRPDPRTWFNVFYVLFADNEPAGLAIVAVFSLLAVWFWFRRNQSVPAPGLQEPKYAAVICLALCAVTFAITAIGTQVVCHDYLLTADENLADFQARIFLRGKLQAEVPAQWRDTVRVIRPTFVDYFPATHSWNATYLPVYAAMRAVFQSVDLQGLLNPLFACLTIAALYGTVRNIWPETKVHALVAIGLLAGSSQFLVMAMTGYAMSAHLALNTIWLWLYSRPDRRSFYLAPLIGVLAIGLHQPIVHALFVAPFLVRLVFQRRWHTAGIFAVIYLAGCVGWYQWKMHFQPPATPGVSSIFLLFNPRMAIIQPMNLLLIIGWASLATPLLVLLGLKQFFKARPIIQDAALSCLLTFGFYYFFYLDQAHGWGYRYFHGALVCLVLVAVAGFNRLCALIGQRHAVAFVVVGVGASFLLQLPLRCMQVERFIRPFAHASTVLHSIRYDMVAFDTRDAWYAADLVRNDPFLEQRPIIVSLFGLTPSVVAALQKNGSTRFLTREELGQLGLSTSRPNDYRYDPFKLGRGK